MQNSEQTTTVKYFEPAMLPRQPRLEADGACESRVARLAEEMARAWRRGLRPGTEEFLARAPELAGEPAAVLDLLYEEICLRHEYGEPVDADAIVERFPTWREQIEVLVRCVFTLETGVIGGFPAVGETLGDFRLLAELGRGGQGRVFVAAQASLGGRPVVLKITPRGGHEHLSLARLQHTHIVPLLSMLEEPERNARVLCMPYFGGLTLAALLSALQDRPRAEHSGQRILDLLDEARAAAAVALPPSRDPATPFLSRASFVQAMAWIGACLAEALKYAHERGLVHLDLKPSNVLLTADRQPMLLDFHLAREPLRAGEPGGHLGGTPLYMSPEQKQALAAIKKRRAIPQAIDGRSDIYSLGFILYEALAGEVPQDDQSLHRRDPHIPVGLSDIVAKCLAADPKNRYHDAGALAADLWSHLNDLPLRGVANRSLAERWRKWRRRKPHLLSYFAMAAALVVMCGLAVGFAILGARQRVAEARLALTESDQLMQSRHYAAAVSALERGLARLGHMPGQQTLEEQLTSNLRRVTSAKLADDLHQIAERFRFMVGMDQFAAKYRGLQARCSEFWDKRESILSKLGDDLDAPLARRARLDLLDLGILGSNLRVGLAAADQVDAARREALQVLEQAEKLFGPSAVLANESRRHAAALGQVAAARAAAGRAANCPPRTAWEHYALGRSLMDDGDLAAAAAHFEQAVAMEPATLWPSFYKGICNYRLGRFEESAIAFTVCTTLAPTNAGCFYNRALAFAGGGHTAWALQDLDRALGLDREFGEAVRLRELLMKNGRGDR